MTFRSEKLRPHAADRTRKVGSCMNVFQIKKVANGFMVMPAYQPSRDYAILDEAILDEAIHVFRTWQQASAWINKQFTKGQQ